MFFLKYVFNSFACVPNLDYAAYRPGVDVQNTIKKLGKKNNVHVQFHMSKQQDELYM